GGAVVPKRARAELSQEARLGMECRPVLRSFQALQPRCPPQSGSHRPASAQSHREGMTVDRRYDRDGYRKLLSHRVRAGLHHGLALLAAVAWEEARINTCREGFSASGSTARAPR